MECEGAVEGVHENHCLHDLRWSDEPSKHSEKKNGPGQICCWCGDLFLSRQEERDGHGSYEPGISRYVRSRREATERKVERTKAKEQREYERDYGTESRVDKMDRRNELNCNYCPPNKKENAKRKPRPDLKKNKRRA